MKASKKTRHAMALLRAHLYKQHEMQALAYEPGTISEKPTIRELVLYFEQRRMLFDIHIFDETLISDLIPAPPGTFHKDLSMRVIRSATPTEYVAWRK